MTQPTVTLLHPGSRTDDSSQKRNSWLKEKLANRRGRDPTTLSGVNWKSDVKNASFSRLTRPATVDLIKRNNNHIASTTSPRTQTNITPLASAKHWPLSSITAIWPRSTQRSISRSRTLPSISSTSQTTASFTFSLPFRGRRRAYSVGNQLTSQPTTPKLFRHRSCFSVTAPLSQDQPETDAKLVISSSSSPSVTSSSATPNAIIKSSSSTHLPSSSTNHEGEKSGEADNTELLSETNENETISLEQFLTLTNKEMKTLTSDQRSMKKRFPEFADEVHLLIDSFACVLQKDIPWHGRLYICYNMACFYGVLFRRRIRKIFPFGEIQGVEKELRFKLFPSAIRITMNNGQDCTLTSFIKRDAAWEVLTNTWQAYKRTLKPSALHQQKQHQSIISILTRSSDDSAQDCDVNQFNEIPQLQRNGKEDIMNDLELSNDVCILHNRSRSDVRYTATSDNGANLLERRSQSLKHNRRQQVDDTPRQEVRNLKLSCDFSDLINKSERTNNDDVSTPMSEGQISDTSSKVTAIGFVTSAVSPSLVDTSSDTLSIEQQDTSQFCGCNDHGKYQLLNIQLAIKPKTAFHALFGENDHAIRPSDREQRWSRDSNGNWIQRDLAYTSFFRPLCVPRKLPFTYEHQRIRVTDYHNAIYKVDTWTRFTAMTAADRIVVYVRWCLTGVSTDGRDTPTHTRIVATAFVEFTRKILIREGAAERTAIERMQSRVRELAGMLSAYVNQLPTLHSIETFSNDQLKITTVDSVLGTSKTVGFNDIVTMIEDETDRVHVPASKKQNNTKTISATAAYPHSWSLKGLLNILANNMAIVLLVLIIFITTYNVFVVLCHDSRSILITEASVDNNGSSASIVPQNNEDISVKWQQQQRYAHTEDSLENLNRLKYCIDRLDEIITQTHYNSHLTRNIIWSTVLGQLACILREDIQMGPKETMTTTTRSNSNPNFDTGANTEQQQQMFKRLDSFSTEFLLYMEHLIIAATSNT